MKKKILILALTSSMLAQDVQYEEIKIEDIKEDEELALLCFEQYAFDDPYWANFEYRELLYVDSDDED